MHEVDRGADTPPYQQVAAQLREAIMDGSLPPRSRVPPILRICQETGVARFTAAKAIAVLAGEGLIVKRQGWGNFVAPREEWPEG